MSVIWIAAIGFWVGLALVAAVLIHHRIKNGEWS